MANYSKHTELIDNYLSGSLSASEQSAFMELMETDPILKDEFLFQQSIVSSLKEYRKDELKHRLNSINVGVGLLGFIMNFTAYKVVAAILTLGITGYGVYYSYENFIIDDNFHSEQTNIPILEEVNYPQLPKNSLPEFYQSEQFSLDQEKNDKVLNSSDNTITSNQEVDKKGVKEESNLIAVTANNKNTQSVISNSENSIPAIQKEIVQLPKFEVPSGEFTNEETFDTSLDNNDLVGIDYSGVEEVNEQIEIKKVEKRSKTIQYKFQQGKLYLFGNFKGKTYELLEINSKENRKLYLYFENHYFRLNQNQRSTKDLDLINDKRLIRELEIIRKNR